MKGTLAKSCLIAPPYITLPEPYRPSISPAKDPKPLRLTKSRTLEYGEIDSHELTASLLGA
jgi:hypothetical protein